MIMVVELIEPNIIYTLYKVSRGQEETQLKTSQTSTFQFGISAKINKWLGKILKGNLDFLKVVMISREFTSLNVSHEVQFLT